MVVEKVLSGLCSMAKIKQDLIWRQPGQDASMSEGVACGQGELVRYHMSCASVGRRTKNHRLSKDEGLPVTLKALR